MDKTRKTINAYDKNSRNFADKFMDFPPYVKRVKDFISLLKSGIKVLDLGCGPGNVSRQLSGSGKKFFITGIDLSEEMLKLARINVSDAKFIVQDIKDINFPEESFDAVILSFCIVHLTDKEIVNLIKKVSKYLTCHGKLYLSFMEGKKEGFEKTSFSEDEIYFYYHSTNKIKKMLTAFGITPFKTVKQNYPEKDGSITSEIFIFGEKL